MLIRNLFVLRATKIFSTLIQEYLYVLVDFKPLLLFFSVTYMSHIKAIVRICHLNCVVENRESIMKFGVKVDKRKKYSYKIGENRMFNTE